VTYHSEKETRQVDSEGTASITDSPAYRLAFEDVDFLHDPDLRPVRLQLELLKPEKHLREHRIRSTIVVFGSARIPAPDVGDDDQASSSDDRPADTTKPRNEIAARRRVVYGRYYDEARRFAQIVSRRFQEAARRDFVIVTGGGPRIMEAANRGAADVGGRSVALNITLPHEQAPNPFVTPDLCFRFHYFALRKMHFLLRAKALVAFPGGFGTFDELFEALTLVQTRKIAPMPIVLIGDAFWRRAVNFDFLVEEGMIAPSDVELFHIVDSADEAIKVLYEFYGGVPPD
jgi:uncharacterized protein (TIGR00730 family)